MSDNFIPQVTISCHLSIINGYVFIWNHKLWLQDEVLNSLSGCNHSGLDLWACASLNPWRRYRHSAFTLICLDIHSLFRAIAVGLLERLVSMDTSCDQWRFRSASAVCWQIRTFFGCLCTNINFVLPKLLSYKCVWGLEIMIPLFKLWIVKGWIYTKSEEILVGFMIEKINFLWLIW